MNDDLFIVWEVTKKTLYGISMNKTQKECRKEQE
jgi:hypothetical protein